jgi:hypothetical protein
MIQAPGQLASSFTCPGLPSCDLTFTHGSSASLLGISASLLGISASLLGISASLQGSSASLKEAELLCRQLQHCNPQL